ncbi:MAG: DNA-binding protein [Polaromonas sp.]|nr:DNA-binding protein [Polaromonas sp.]
MGIREVIRQNFAGLSPALQDIAKFVLDRPNDVVTVSMRTVAQRSATKPPTLVRFAQHFGFKGWPELKAALALDMGLGPEQYGERAKTLVGRVKDDTLVSEMFKVQRLNLEATERLNEGTLQRVCAILEKAQAVHSAGFRACFPVAFSFTYVYRLFRNAVHLVDGQGGSLEMQLRALGKSDALVVISFTPYSKEALQAAQAAKAAGCAIIAMTDSAASPISLLADETILFAIHSPSFFPSVTAALAVTEALLEMLASRAGKAGVRRIDQSETDLFASGAYLQAPKLRSPV